jgi:hypothetical protein
MTAPRTPEPSPLAGEGGPEQREGPGEGAIHGLRASGAPPHSASRSRSTPPSPARGEGSPTAAAEPRNDDDEGFKVRATATATAKEIAR